ncbi:GNAT family N-acetyltransferase [Dermacoccaceae bacterium W4C1]
MNFEDAQTYARTVTEGERVRLRPLAEPELPQLEQWWFEPETLLMQTTSVVARPAGGFVEQLRSWHANTDLNSGAGFAVARRSDDELLGSVTLHSVTARSLQATLGIVLGEPHQGYGYGVEATALMVDFGFRTMPLHRIELQVFGPNERAIATYERAGFRIEGRRREVVYADGTWQDEVIMGVLRQEWDERPTAGAAGR